MQKFESHDKRDARRANAHVFGAYTEQKKLKLLDQKKNILTQLLQTSAAEARAHPPPHLSRAGGSQSDARSTTSGESWATFASSSRGGGAPRPPPKIVPKLKM